jgi:hypothetical protein
MAPTSKKGRTLRAAAERTAAASRRGGDELKLKFEPRGPEQSALEELGRSLLQAPAVREQLGRARHRLLSPEVIDDDLETKTARPPQAPERFRARKFLVVRPAASSGTRGSGVELRFVDYKGKRVLYRAHVPILNVKYDDGEAANSPDAPYPRGDVWILRYRGTELDDGVNCTTGGPGCTTEADLDKFVNGESVNDKDVVVWYAGHVTHDVAHEPPGSFGHVVGPDLKRIKW